MLESISRVAILKKAVESQTDHYLALLNYGASLLEHGMSPEEMQEVQEV